MGHKVIWSPNALTDLKDISDFIRKSSPVNADAVIMRIVDAVAVLETHPRIGRMTPEEQTDDLREILVLSWRVVYEIFEFRVEIHQAVHGAQRWSG